MNNTYKKLLVIVRKFGIKGWQAIRQFFSNRKKGFNSAPWYGKIGLSLLYLFLLFLLYLLLVDINFLWLFGKSPSIENVRHPEPNVASEIYSSDGKLIGKYFRENRTPVKYEDINPMLVNTLIATEDERFYDHFGIDFQGLFAAVKDMALYGKTRGASTITQQLVKNMFKTRSQFSTGLLGHIPGLSIIIAKTKEWITAIKIECIYDKQEILTMYLNTVDFGSNAYGIKTAAKTYFGTTPKDLTTEQSATLVGMLKATTTYNPKINPKNSRMRRNVVLENLRDHHLITKEECDSLKKIEIDMRKYVVEKTYDGNALYFREAVADELEEWCKEKDIDLYADGLKIYTTVDSRMQKYAEEAVSEQMKRVQRSFNAHWGTQEPWRDEHGQIIPDFIENIARHTDTYKALKSRYPNDPDSIRAAMNKVHKVKVFDWDKGYIYKDLSSYDSIRYMERFLHTGFVAMEPTTGYIKAWVGDIDFNFWKYDKVRAQRQPGSTFKLFVYTEAMNQGMSPCDYERDSYVAWDYPENGEMKHWTPHNADGFFSNANMTLKCAFAQSCNAIAVKLAQQTGIDNIVRTAYKMGIKTHLHERPSTSLGASDVTLEELVNAYCTILNDGRMHDPVLVERIVDADGKEIYNCRNEKHQDTQAVPYETAFLMQQMLRGALTEPGATSQPLWSYISGTMTDFGGKTGTSNNHSDAWFVGVSPHLVGGAWVGGEHRCIHFRTGKLGSGGKIALPIVGTFFKKVLTDAQFASYRGRFSDKPKQTIDRTYNCGSSYIAAPSQDSLSGDSLQEEFGEEIPSEVIEESMTKE